MRRYLSGTFAAHPFGLTAAAVLVVLAFPTYRLIDETGKAIHLAPGQLYALQTAIELVPGQIVDRLTEKDGLIDRHAARIEDRATGQLQQVQHQVSRLIDGDPNAGTSEGTQPLRMVILSRVDRFLTLAEKTEQDLTTQVAAISTQVDAQLGAANNSLSALAETYTELPDRIGETLKPAYVSLLPEITCRDAFGNGYGGCMRGRINGMLGEGVRIGGVFVQRFPELSLSINGIAKDINTFTTKAVAPRGFWGTVKDVTFGSTRIIGAIR